MRERMRATRAAAGTAALACALAFVARETRAEVETPAEPIVLSYTAPPECPGESSFFQGIRARTNRVQRAENDPAARRFSVTVEQRETGYRASLQIEAPDGAVNRREVDGVSCADVVAAVELVAALAVDPQASIEPRAPLSVDAAPPSPPVAPPAPAPLVVPEPPRPVPPPLDDRAAVATQSGARPVRYRWSVGAGPELLAAVVPSVAFGGAAHVDAAPSSDAPFLPSFRVGLTALTTHLTRAGAAAQLTWWFVRGEACPVRWIASTLGAEACASFDVGGLTSSGEQVDRPTSATRAWAAAGLGTRVRWRPAARWELSLEPALVLPLRRYQLGYVGAGGQSTVVSDISAASMSLSLAAAYAFP